MVGRAVWRQVIQPKMDHGPRASAVLALICPQTSVKAIGGQVASVHHMLTMPFDDPSMDGDLRAALGSHEIVLGEEWADME